MKFAVLLFILAALAAVASAKDTTYAVILASHAEMGTNYPVMRMAPVAGPCVLLNDDADVITLKAGQSASAQFSASPGASCELSWGAPDGRANLTLAVAVYRHSRLAFSASSPLTALHFATSWATHRQAMVTVTDAAGAATACQQRLDMNVCDGLASDNGGECALRPGLSGVCSAQAGNAPCGAAASQAACAAITANFCEDTSCVEDAYSICVPDTDKVPKAPMCAWQG